MAGTCPVVTVPGKPPCGRQSWDRDSRHHCYFHSEVRKDPAEFLTAFLKDVEALQLNPKVDELDFRLSVFPRLEIPKGYSFEKALRLDRARFNDMALFDRIRFNDIVSFSSAHFSSVASFEGAAFETGPLFGGAQFQDASFKGVRIKGIANFDRARFSEVDFRNAVLDTAHFHQTSFYDCDFSDAVIEDASFISVSFESRAYFVNTRFKKKAYFGGSIFMTVDFRDAIFNEANFIGSVFNEGVDFSGSTFNGWTNFEDVVFKGSANFGTSSLSRKPISFSKNVDFPRAVFDGKALFNRTVFTGKAAFASSLVNGHLMFQDVTASDRGSIDFRYVTILQKDAVEFIGHNDTLSLSRARFLHTDATKIRFRNVEWCAKGRVFDEMLYDSPESLSQEENDGTGPANAGEGATLESLEALYRDLRRNYEDSLRYPEAGDFYIREMEAKRRQIAADSRLGAWRWLRQRIFSLYGVYGLLSSYGESYRRAGGWIVSTLMFFAVARFAIPALDGTMSLDFVSAFSHSFEAFFQLRGVTLLDGVERLWALLLLALFFLAVRRRLRR